MSWFKRFMDGCSTNFQEMRVRCRVRTKPSRSGPCIMPQTVPEFQIPKARDARHPESDSHTLCVDGELLAHIDLPFNVHTLRKTRSPEEEHPQHEIIKQNQRLACYFADVQSRGEPVDTPSSAEDGEEDDAVVAVAKQREEEETFESAAKENDDDGDFDPDNWEFKVEESMLFLPTVQDIPSPFFERLDLPTGSFYRKKPRNMITCGPEVVGRFQPHRDCEADTLPTQDCSQRSPHCYRRMSSVQMGTSDNRDDPRSDRNHFYFPAINPTMGSSRASTRWNQKCRRAELGELKFEFVYLSEETQLMVTLIRGDTIGGLSELNPDRNVYVKLCLMPGKAQTQFSEDAKHTTEARFCDEFFFHISLEDVQNMSLRMKAYSDTPSQPKQFLGQINLNLTKYNLLETNRMWRNLQPRARDMEDLGHLHVGLQVNVTQHHLKVTINRATGLSQHFSGGPPNPFVSVEVSQEPQYITEMQTKIFRQTCYPMFKESLMFKLSHVDVENLKHTCVVISVIHRDLAHSDPTIGQVRLGCDCTESTELLHWQEVLLSPERHVGRWHYLM